MMPEPDPMSRNLSPRLDWTDKSSRPEELASRLTSPLS